MSTSKKKNEPSEQEKRAAARIEWALAGISAVLLVATVVFLLVQATRQGDGLPDIQITSERVEAQGEQRFVVSIVAHNRGEMAAAEVRVIGELRPRQAAPDSEPLETTECTLDYVPSRSKTHGALVFPLDPAGHELKLRVGGYQQP